MRITVFGATGATGRKVVEIALARGHHVIAVARRPEGAHVAEGAIVRQGDVLDAQSLDGVLESADAAISCIGPANNLAPGTLMSRGIANIVALCESKHVRRFVFQSGILMTDGRELSLANRVAVRTLRCVFAASVRDKSIAERMVERSHLEWVIVRPAGLTEAPARANYITGPLARIAPLRALPFSNCAECLVRATDEPTWSRRIVNVGL